MPLDITETTIGNVLTRTSGFLKTVTSHSLQPYRGCSFGNALCGVGCYVRHNGHVLRGRRWGSFLEVRINAASSYEDHFLREQTWARKSRGRFSIFLSSSTDPFVPQEQHYGVTRALLTAMIERPPDELVVQTHSHQVVRYRELLLILHARCRLRVHITIETDRDDLPGLPPHASPLSRRFESCRELHECGLFIVVTVAPLLPLHDPDRFFEHISQVGDAVVIDHFIQGDGSADGSRTLRTDLPAAMRNIEPQSLTLDYRDQMVAVARRHLPGRVGVNIDGFAGRYLPDGRVGPPECE